MWSKNGPTILSWIASVSDAHCNHNTPLEVQQGPLCQDKFPHNFLYSFLQGKGAPLALKYVIMNVLLSLQSFDDHLCKI